MTEDETNKLSEKLEKIADGLALIISKIVRSIDNKEQRLEAISRLNPPIPQLKKVDDIALKNEDYETCEVIKYYLEQAEDRGKTQY